MNSNVEEQVDVLQAEALRGFQLIIAVAFYKNEELVEPLLGSMIQCAGDLAVIGAEVLLINDSPDYLPLQAALEAMLPSAQAAFACRLIRNPVNLGFVQTMNRAVSEAVRKRQDILLLNSDTILLPGALPEMVRIAAFDEMIGFVNPRSDNATLATLPAAHRRRSLESGFDPAPYAALAGLLPELTYVPTAVGFCMLIRWQILAEFGGFDEIYGAGYNEENDLVMRAGRCGYRAVLANRAFVRHAGEKSFSLAAQAKTVLEARNRPILEMRYPEYPRLVAEYEASPEAIVEDLLSTLIADDAGRLDLAFDCSSFMARHTGTYKAGWQLMQSAMQEWSGRFKIHVLCSQEVYDFHAYSELGVTRREPHGPEKFAVIFRVGQVYDWQAMQRLVQKAAVIGIHMLDTISLDCTQLSSAKLYDLWQFSIAHGDFFVTPSAQSLRQIRLRFQIPERVLHATSMLSLNLADYTRDNITSYQAPNPDQPILLVVGNHFPHKFLVPTANALAAAFPDRNIVALGQSKSEEPAGFNPYRLPPLSASANLTGIDVGHVEDAKLSALYRGADAVIFPSHYEGFGYPVLDALAARRPVFVRPLPVFKELFEALGCNPNIHFYASTSDLVTLLQKIPLWQEPQSPPSSENGAKRSAREIVALAEACLARVDHPVLVARLRAVHAVADPANIAVPPALAPMAAIDLADQVAGFAAARFEWLTRKAFRLPPVYLASRTLFRALRPMMRAARKALRTFSGRNVKP